METLASSYTDKIAALPLPVKAFWAFAAGAVMVAAMPPWCIWPVLFIGLSAFYLLLSTVKTVRAAFGFGWLFGFGYFVAGLSWIGNALLVEGNEFAIFWPLAVAGLPVLLALFTASAAAFSVRLVPLNSFAGYLFFCGSLMIFEWLRGHAFTGFPWNLYGYAWAETLPMAQLASIGGIYWLSLATCLWATLPGFLLVWRHRRALKLFLVILLMADMGGAYLWGAHRLEAHPPAFHDNILVKVVQPHIPQADKWNPAKRAENFEKLLSLSGPGTANAFAHTLVIWPETAITSHALQDSTARNAIKAVLRGYENNVYLLTGIMRVEAGDGDKRKYYNSLATYDRQLEPVHIYDKSHLVPFGEYIPFQRYIPLEPVVKFSGLEKGAGPQTLPLPGPDITFSPLVCYEIIFSGAITATQNRPDFIVNVTNDAWYGDSGGPRQHFVMAQFRAIEEGIPVIRSANTGVSGIIDPAGRIIARIRLGEYAQNSVKLPKTLAERPFFPILKDRLFFAFILFFTIFSFLYHTLKK